MSKNEQLELIPNIVRDADFSSCRKYTGQPKHPLYLPENTKLQGYRPREDRRIINSRNKNGRLYN